MLVLKLIHVSKEPKNVPRITNIYVVRFLLRPFFLRSAIALSKGHWSFSVGNIWGLWCQKQAFQAGKSNCIPQKLWGISTYPCLKCLLLTPESPFLIMWDLLTVHDVSNHLSFWTKRPKLESSRPVSHRPLHSPGLVAARLSTGYEHGLQLAGITLLWLADLNTVWDTQS